MASVMRFILLVTCLAHSEVGVFGLRCRVDHDEETQRAFQDIVRSCMSVDFRGEESNNNNNHNHNNWQHNSKGPEWAGIPRFPTKDQRDRNNREDEDEDARNNNNNNRNNKNGGFGYGTRGGGTGRPRARRASGIGTTVGGGRARNNPNNTNPFNRRLADESSLEEVEPCIIHCIFRQMQMLSGDNELDRGSVARVMTGRLRDRQLRDFIREAIAECFDLIEQDNQDKKCSVTKDFAMCLEQKGKQNCEDWDDDIQKPKPKHGGINVNNKHRG